MKCTARRPRRSWRGRVGVAAVTALVAYWLWLVIIPAGSGPPQLIVIRAGDSAWQVSRLLDGKGIVRNSTAMTAAAYLTGRWRHIRAGRHEVGPSMNTLEILSLLCRNSSDCWSWLTIPEGYTLGQIATSMQEAGLGEAERLLREAQDLSQFSAPFPLPETGLEGYLFPDTYRLGPGEEEADLLQQMLRRFDEVVWRGLFHRWPTYRGRGLNEVIILASLVEAEAKRPQERPVIAGVLMRRLRAGQRLECDATVQYALGEGRKPRLTAADTQLDSPYNTYLHPGLPPGPVCNPGEASIRAAMEPAEVPYLYYVARPDGSHVFSRTFEEHQAAVARLR